MCMVFLHVRNGFVALDGDMASIAAVGELVTSVFVRHPGGDSVVRRPCKVSGDDRKAESRLNDRISNFASPEMVTGVSMHVWLPVYDGLLGLHTVRKHIAHRAKAYII